jgi:ubiquinone/menaquinone biosynthesis C-methylase UbiE
MAESKPWTGEWDDPEIGKHYGDLFYKRATGELAEMESSKAAAKRIATLAKAGDAIVDVGCGGGHYLRSLQRVLTVPFSYHGVDRTPYYIEMARRAFDGQQSISFGVGDIFNLELKDQSADIVMCNNVVMHLPSCAKPLHELVRVARRGVLVRTLVGPTSYQVKSIGPRPDGDDFDANGEPISFHYLNIYSEAYVRRVLKNEPRVKAVTIEPDTDFDPAKISDTAVAMSDAWDVTRPVNGMQFIGMIAAPYHWISISLG